MNANTDYFEINATYGAGWNVMVITETRNSTDTGWDTSADIIPLHALDWEVINHGGFSLSFPLALP